jgi:hypothetical protein
MLILTKNIVYYFYLRKLRSVNSFPGKLVPGFLYRFISLIARDWKKMIKHNAQVTLLIVLIARDWKKKIKHNAQVTALIVLIARDWKKNDKTQRTSYRAYCKKIPRKSTEGI